MLTSLTSALKSTSPNFFPQHVRPFVRNVLDNGTIFWYWLGMRIRADKLKELCRQRDTTLTRLLEEAGVSKNAYYSLVRKHSVLPKSVLAIADHLDIQPSAFLEDVPDESGRKDLLEGLSS